MKYFYIKCFFYLSVFLVITSSPAAAQDKYEKLQTELNKLAENTIPQLNERVNISVTNTQIQDFLRGVANSSGLNINVDPQLQIKVANNFSNVKVVDVLLFLVRQYNLSITVIGNIINIEKEISKPVINSRKNTVTIDNATGNISIECENDDLINFAKDMASATGRNLVPAPGLDRQKVNAYIQNMPIENALEKFAFTNNLSIKKSDDGVFLVERLDQTNNTQLSGKQQSGKKSNTRLIGNPKQGQDNDLHIEKTGTDSISINAEDVPIVDIIKQAADELKKQYYFTSQLQGNSTITLKSICFEQLLDYLLKGTSYTYQTDNGIYLIGDTKNGELKEFRMVHLQNRMVDKLTESIPKEMLRDIEIKEFPELNTLYISGTSARIQQMADFIKSLDQVIPVILIEIMIVDIKKNTTVSTGIDAGIADKPVATSGTAFTKMDMTLGAKSINDLLSSFDGFGSVKLGKVTPNFYLSIKALEENGYIDIQSTPKLSTLNGHEATLSIGNTEYYREQTSNYYGSISTQMATNEIYKPVTAELTVKINPHVSGDDQITLEIEVTQGDFTTRISQYAPPGQVKREFKSLIRIKNQEMILLGGLEENRKNESGSGVPILSRLPIIKWFFSSRTDANAKSKLNIFIKPTIIE
jgi:type IV pilus assembly protein PilQ